MANSARGSGDVVQIENSDRTSRTELFRGMKDVADGVAARRVRRMSR